MSTLHERILRGDGSAASPFVFHTASYLLSAAIQHEILDSLFGSGNWKTVERLYSGSPNGLPENRDLLEYRVDVRGELRSVFFDLFMVTRLAEDSDLKAAKQAIMTPELLAKAKSCLLGTAPQAKQEKATLQVTIDRSPSDMAPVAELELLNKGRALAQKQPIGLIEQQTSTFKNYGVSVDNPIVVSGTLGLAVYLKTLRFKECTSPVRGTLNATVLAGEYPVDQILVSAGSRCQKLFFCIYGRNSDKIYPLGFYREPFNGSFDFEMGSLIYLGDPVKLRGVQGNESDRGACVWNDTTDKLQILLNADNLGSLLEWGELQVHVMNYSTAIRPRLRSPAQTQSCSPFSQPLPKQEPRATGPAPETCWFSGLPANPRSELRVELFGDFKRTHGLISKSIEYRKMVVRIPRSTQAEVFHNRNNSRGGVFAILFGIIGWAAAGILPGLVWWCGLLVGGGTGLIYGWITTQQCPSAWKPFEEHRRHPALAELLAQGWSESKPSP